MLYTRFGSIYLAAAAYNAGGGKISRTLNRLDIDPVEDEDGSQNFSDEHFFRMYNTRLIRQETKDYVPKLIAAALIAKEPARYGFTVPTGIAPYATDSIVVSDMTGFDVLARIADTSVAAIRELNPQFLRMSTPPGRSVVIRVPEGHGAAAQAAYAALAPGDRVTFAVHGAAKGETLSRIAQRYGVTLAFLQEANPAVGTGRLKAGTQVLVPQGGALSVAITRELASASTAQFHRVRRGETLARIARRYGVTVSELRRWNGLGAKASAVGAGRRLRVTEPDAPVLTSRQAADPARGNNKAAVAATRATTATAKPAKALRHVVKRGETLASVARRYGVSVADLQLANHLGTRQTIRTGTALRIPS
jgi:membrane-bound lytic murein transglycosylase D